MAAGEERGTGCDCVHHLGHHPWGGGALDRGWQCHRPKYPEAANLSWGTGHAMAVHCPTHGGYHVSQRSGGSDQWLADMAGHLPIRSPRKKCAFHPQRLILHLGL
jgi:hypothetical protein